MSAISALSQKTSASTANTPNTMLNPTPYQNNPAPMSSIVQQYFSNPSLRLSTGTSSAQYLKTAAPAAASSSDPNIRGNLEPATQNLPQDEESVAAYNASGPTYVVTGANDYRGFFGALCGGIGISGWYVSLNGGTSIAGEGCLPPLTGTNNIGAPFAAGSYGDPSLAVFKGDGSFYYSTLALDSVSCTSAIGLYKATLASVGTGSPVWSSHQVVADDNCIAPFTFNDKPWMTIDNNATSPGYGDIYISWTQFSTAGSPIVMVECSHVSLFCTAPLTVSTGASGPNDQGSWVSVDSTGRVVVTWTNYYGNPNAPYFTIGLFYAVYSAGLGALIKAPTSLWFDYAPTTFGIALEGNSMRVPVLPQSATAVTKTGTLRLFVTWQDCVLGTYLRNIPSFGEAWSCSGSSAWIFWFDNYVTSPVFVSGYTWCPCGTTHQLFPTIAVNQARGSLDWAYYQANSLWKELLQIQYWRLNITNPFQVFASASTPYEEDTAMDSFFTGPGFRIGFLGDYIQIVDIPPSTAGASQVYIGYTSNLRGAPPAWYNNGFYLQLIGGHNDDNNLWSFTY